MGAGGGGCAGERGGDVGIGRIVGATGTVVADLDVDEEEVQLLVPAALSRSSTPRSFCLIATSALTRRMMQRYRKAPKKTQKKRVRQRASAIV